ncbi:MAG: 3-deoxy-D-manno-octulosonic acid transferase [Alphaproteobacteria bacterium]|jgi:3-deoxy-D-manno-octulosonic-acid transferase
MFLYKFLLTIFYPIIRIVLTIRRNKGKEDAHPDRFAERLGRPSLARPNGFLIWLHGASVGEINSMRGLIEHLHKNYPKAEILLTSGTTTSAKIAKNFDVIHQYSPIDVPFVIRRFIRHWQPDMAIRVDSDLWPIQLDAIQKAKIPNFLINGAISKKSFRRYQKNKFFTRKILNSFTKIMAKSKLDAQHFRNLGAKNVSIIDNLKYTVPFLPDKPTERKKIMTAINTRPIWHAAVLGEGESKIIFDAHREILKKLPKAFLIITPRHPKMKEELAQSGKDLKITFRSDNTIPSGNVYVADTIGEMGLFYRCAKIAFMGRSLLPECRGSSPIEAMQLDNIIITGKHTSTFNEVYDEMSKNNILERIDNEKQLSKLVLNFLNNKKIFDLRATATKKFIANKKNTINVIMKELKPYLKQIKS